MTLIPHQNNPTDDNKLTQLSHVVVAWNTNTRYARYQIQLQKCLGGK